MDYTTCWLPLVLATFTLTKSDVGPVKCNKYSGGNSSESKLSRGKEMLAALCHEYLMTETHIFESAFSSKKLPEDECKLKLQQSDGVNNNLKATIDVLTKTEEANNRTIQEQREKQKQLQANIDHLIKREEAINRTVHKQREKQKQLQANIDDLTKTEEANNRTIQELREDQKQLRTTIDDLTKTVQSLNQTVQLLCGQPNDVCRDLIEAAKSGDVNTVKILFKCTKDNCSTDDRFRNTPLTEAASSGHVAVVRVLLNGGANTERRNAYQRTALHEAARFGHLDVCSLLLDRGAKVDPQNTWNDTPLHDAAWKGHLSVVKLLVERGADVRLKSNNGRTASDWARSGEHNDVADWLDSVRRE